MKEYFLGILWRAVYAPGDGQTSPAYSIHSVQYLYTVVGKVTVIKLLRYVTSYFFK